MEGRRKRIVNPPLTCTYLQWLKNIWLSEEKEKMAVGVRVIWA